MFVTLETSQGTMFWLNSRTPLSMEFIFFTRDTSQEPMGWLNAGASQSIASMFVALETSQEPMGWLNAWTPQNIASMVVAPETSQPEMSSLKVGEIGCEHCHGPLTQAQKIYDMSVTADTFQVDIFPYVASAEARSE